MLDIKKRIQNLEDRIQKTEYRRLLLRASRGVLQDVDQVGQLLDVMLSGVNDGADFLERGPGPTTLFEADLPIRIELDEHGVHGIYVEAHQELGARLWAFVSRAIEGREPNAKSRD
jgi:hypothetical protein